MRAFTKRRYETSTDDYGNPVYSWQEYLSDVPCFAWYSKGGQTKHEDKDTLNLDTAKMMYPLDTDILATDTIEKIEDRRGESLFGAFTIEAVNRKHDHNVLTLAEVK